MIRALLKESGRRPSAGARIWEEISALVEGVWVQDPLTTCLAQTLNVSQTSAIVLLTSDFQTV